MTRQPRTSEAEARRDSCTCAEVTGTTAGVGDPHYLLGVKPHVRAYGSTKSTSQHVAADLQVVCPPHLESNENTLLREHGDVRGRKHGRALMQRAAVVFGGLLALGLALTAVRSSRWEAPYSNTTDLPSGGGGVRNTQSAMPEVSSGCVFHGDLQLYPVITTWKTLARVRVSLLLWLCICTFLTRWLF